MAGDYWEEHYWDDYALGGLGGAATGATTGATIGALAGGGVLSWLTAPVGAVIGGAAGLVGGLAKTHGSVSAQKAAQERDEDIEAQLEDIDKEIRDVDSLGKFIAATGAGAAEQAQNATVKATQDAARMGLSAGATAEYTRQKERDVGAAYSRMLAQALPASQAADQSEKNRLQQEKQFVLSGSADRQSLMNQGEKGSDLLGVMGDIGKFAMMAQGFAETAPVKGESPNVSPTSKYGDMGYNKPADAGTSMQMDVGGSKAASKYGDTGIPDIGGGGGAAGPPPSAGGAEELREYSDAGWSFREDPTSGKLQTSGGPDDLDWTALPKGAETEVKTQMDERFGKRREIEEAVDKAIGEVVDTPGKGAPGKSDRQVFRFHDRLEGGAVTADDSSYFGFDEGGGLLEGGQDWIHEYYPPTEYEESVLGALQTLFGNRRSVRHERQAGRRGKRAERRGYIRKSGGSQ